MLERTGFMPIPYLKKTSYTGSYQGMRFKMEKARAGEGEEEKDVLRVTHWPEPLGYDATKEELKTQMDTSFDEEGILKGIDWLNKEYEERYRTSE